MLTIQQTYNQYCFPFWYFWCLYLCSCCGQYILVLW